MALALVVVAMTGCTSREFRVLDWHCQISPRIEDEVRLNASESLDEKGLQALRLHLTCPI